MARAALQLPEPQKNIFILQTMDINTIILIHYITTVHT